MDNICLTIPVLPGQAEAARSFLRALDGPRRGDYAESERRIGGLDLNDPPEIQLPELLSHYDAGVPTGA
jgi:hypothetical protein